MHRRSTYGVVTTSLITSLVICLVLTAVPVRAQEETDTGGEAADTMEDRGRSPALTHVHHVSVAFRGTPDDMGLLPTAVAEAEIALRHAELAAGDPADLSAIQRHVGHVMHALDPSAVEDGGPGLGYGAIHGAERTAHYIGLAAVSDGASESVRTHAEHIEAAAGHAATTGAEALEIAQEILAADDAAVAGELLEDLVEGADAMLNGLDADGDGRIGWQEGEGGLAQAARHLELLRRAEGLSEG
jgi:hypothetical protein